MASVVTARHPSLPRPWWPAAAGIWVSSVAAAPRAIRGSRGISQLSAKVHKQLGKDVGDTVRVTVAPR